jgi:hypothetical protein
MNGPNILCVECGAVCNHVSLRCVAHRQPQPDLICRRGGDGLTDADRAYLEWKRQKDAAAQPTHHLRADLSQWQCEVTP